jgi:hypothetical protein
MVVDLPKGMPIGGEVYEKAKFAGYFLKLQGYHAFGVRPGTVPDRAPLLIGRLEWTPSVAVSPPVDSRQEWIWGLSFLALIGFVLGLRFVYFKWFRKKAMIRPVVHTTSTGEVIPIDAWLEQAGFGDATNPTDDTRDHEQMKE